LFKSERNAVWGGGESSVLPICTFREAVALPRVHNNTLSKLQHHLPYITHTVLRNIHVSVTHALLLLAKARTLVACKDILIVNIAGIIAKSHHSAAVTSLA
jgi:hypothetical protein